MSNCVVTIPFFDDKSLEHLTVRQTWRQRHSVFFCVYRTVFFLFLNLYGTPGHV